MSIWGVGAFDNDDAADWLTELDASPELGAIEEAISEIAHPAIVGYTEIPECNIAIAAAEVFARLAGGGAHGDGIAAELWGELKNALDRMTPEEIGWMSAQAHGAVERIFLDADDSELRQVWQESPTEFASWETEITNLLDRLHAIVSRAKS